MTFITRKEQQILLKVFLSVYDSVFLFIYILLVFKKFKMRVDSRKCFIFIENYNVY